MAIPKKDIIQQLRKEIIALDGLRHVPLDEAPQEGLSLFAEHFPQGRFPLGAVHEYLPASTADQPAALGFCLALMRTVLPPEGLIAWVSAHPAPLYGPGLKQIGIDPARVIFVQARKPADRQWAMEEVLQCPSLAAVVGEPEGLDFKQSRRLQLAAEKSGVTAFILPTSLRQRSNAATSRWSIRSLPSLAIDSLPGVGSPHWGVELRHMRHGKPGSWEICWTGTQFTSTRWLAASTEQEMAELPAALAVAGGAILQPFPRKTQLPTGQGHEPLTADGQLSIATTLRAYPAADLLEGYYVHEKRVYA